MGLSEIVADEVEQIEEDENEIYFYTTPEIAGKLRVGWTNILMSDQNAQGRMQMNLFVLSIETRLASALPESDGPLFYYTPRMEFEDAVGKGHYKRGVLVSGEITR